MEEYCCSDFKMAIINGELELGDDGESYSINGCCGGGCYVVTGAKFCPFCGERLE